VVGALFTLAAVAASALALQRADAVTSIAGGADPSRPVAMNVAATVPSTVSTQTLPPLPAATSVPPVARPIATQSKIQNASPADVREHKRPKRRATAARRAAAHEAAQKEPTAVTSEAAAATPTRRVRLVNDNGRGGDSDGSRVRLVR
jgi:hypothetical protein